MDKDENRQDDLLHTVIVALNRNIVLILAIIVVFTAAGLVYSLVKKPVYNASSVASFSVSNEHNSQYNNNILTNNFIDTMIDFCDEGYVVERANYYYEEYKEEYKKNGVPLDQFVADVKEGVRCSEYVRGSFDGVGSIFSDNISVEALSTSEKKIYGFTINYKDGNAVSAEEKVRILVLAVREEAKAPGSSVGKTHYFGYSTVAVEGSERATVAADSSKKKTVVIFFVLGVIASAVAVYIKSNLNCTIRDKKELENITGTDVLSYIDYHGGGF